MTIHPAKCEAMIMTNTHFVGPLPQLTINLSNILSNTYGIVAWGSCNKTPFQDLGKVHVRAAKIIFKFDWTTPSTEVLSKANRKTMSLLYKYKIASSCI